MATFYEIETSTFAVFCILISLNGISTTSLEDLKASICGPSKGLYDISQLTSPKVWSLNYTENSTACVGYNSNTIRCDFLFSFCHGYNCSSTDESLMNTSACLLVESKNKALSKMYKLGSYDPNKNPFEDASEGTTSKFVVHFINGSPYNATNTTSCKLLMDMTFNCNQNALWVEQKQGVSSTVNKTLLKSIKYDPILCKYNLDFDYNGACPYIEPLDILVEDLSAGTVLILIFCVTISVYCIIGATIKCCQGSRGKEILPHSNFWIMLPVYVADGFIFTFEKCCLCTRTATDARYDSI